MCSEEKEINVQMQEKVKETLAQANYAVVKEQKDTKIFLEKSKKGISDTR